VHCGLLSKILVGDRIPGFRQATRLLVKVLDCDVSMDEEMVFFEKRCRDVRNNDSRLLEQREGRTWRRLIVIAARCRWRRGVYQLTGTEEIMEG
jgi:hypothetical protein